MHHHYKSCRSHPSRSASTRAIRDDDNNEKEKKKACCCTTTRRRTLAPTMFLLACALIILTVSQADDPLRPQYHLMRQRRIGSTIQMDLSTTMVTIICSSSTIRTRPHGAICIGYAQSSWERMTARFSLSPVRALGSLLQRRHGSLDSAARRARSRSIL